MSQRAKDDVLLPKKSIKKKCKQNKVCLPFPVPFKKEDNCVIWPLEKSEFLRFSAILNREKKYCEVHDKPSSTLLSSLGYFGELYCGDINYSTVFKFKDIRKFSLDENECEQLSDSDSKILEPFQLHNNSLVNAFNEIPDKKSIISQLYGCEFEPNCCDTNLTNEGQSNVDNNGSEKNESERRNDVIKVSNYESWKLNFVETYFLSYALGVLDVVCDESKQKLSLSKMWNLFCNLHNSNDFTEFPVLYAVYHYFRAKGWIVRNGLQFGSDYLLYKEGPPFYHSLFSVTVVRKSNESNKCKPELSWKYLLGFNRVTNCVAKQSMLCFVLIPDDLSDQCWKHPSVIEKFKIQTVAMERWVASEQRQNDENT
ncbi:tRNA-splicing endonuclease subunit Sen2-like protein [Leptotrombidium deliense]|uniref:tRNA-intron lyase n=1 Tax=Leptotrombidium deliense TaxID=299467 RepID=A0A443SVJ5_9ACAR|nr:tRNA-splicing endonuclease subunit Sen2-like protein [Leptotrombidium deliense]